MSIKKIKFGDLFEYENKSKIKAGDGLVSGQYPFFTSSSELSKYIDEYSFDKTCLIFGTGGNASIHYCETPFSVSTDCLVVFVKDETVCFPKFVFYYLFGNINLLEEGFKGAGLKHISKGFINDLLIPLPPLQIQKRIAEILDTADALRRKDQELLKKYDELAQAIFIDMFGDPVKNERGWEMKSVIDYCDCIVPGRDKPKSFTGSLPWITTDDLVHLGKTSKSKKNLGLSSVEIEAVNAKIVPSNSVIITCVGNLGVISMNDIPIVLNQQLHTFQCQELMNAYFLMHSLSYQKDYMYKMSSSTTVPYMNKGICNSIPTICPPIEMQKAFEVKLMHLKVLEKTSSAEYSRTLFASLIQKAFKGELVS